MTEKEPTINPPDKLAEEALHQRQRDLVEQIKLARQKKDTGRLRVLMEELASISLPQPEKGEIAPESLEQAQSLYDWLAIEVDLPKEYQEGKIVLPSPEQQEAAEKQGYTLPLIVAGGIGREELLQKVKDKFAQEFSTPEQSSQGIIYGDQAQKDLSHTQQAQNSSRPPQSYLIYLPPPREVSQTQPATMGKTFSQCQEILANLQKENPELNLQGLTLEEYLLAQALVYQQDQGHLEEKTWTWLLEEQIIERGRPARCLDADWGPDAREVGVGSSGSSDADSGGGARFAAVPKESSP